MIKFRGKEGFIKAKIKVGEDKKAVVILEDGNYKKLYSQRYEYTDFPLSEFEFFIVANEVNSYSFMLKGEY